MQLKTVLVLAAAVATASAGSHHHYHNHARHQHHHVDRRDSGNFVKAVKSLAAKPSPTPAPTPESAPSPAPDAIIQDVTSVVSDVSSAVQSAVSDAVDTVYKAFCGGSVSRRATGAEIAYVGNTGTPGDYGCNIMEVPDAIASSYEYTMKITNVASEPYQIICWNKIGRTGGINGFFKGMGEAVTLNLAAGASATVAFEANSQGACGFAPASLPTSAEGCYQGTWAEFDFENASNKGWSGADCSCLTSADTGGTPAGCKLCDSAGTCSIIYSDGTGSNSYTKGTNALDGVGINSAPGNVTYYLDVGYAK